MLQIMLSADAPNTIKKTLLRVCTFSSITKFTARHNVIDCVANTIVDPIQPAVEEYITGFSGVGDVIGNAVAVKTSLLTQGMKKFLRNFPRISPIETSVFNVVIYANKVSSIATFGKCFRNKTFTSTSTGFCFARFKLTMFYFVSSATNTLTFPKCSSSSFKMFLFSTDYGQETKCLPNQIQSLHNVTPYWYILTQNGVNWYA